MPEGASLIYTGGNCTNILEKITSEITALILCSSEEQSINGVKEQTEKIKMKGLRFIFTDISIYFFNF